MTSQTGKRKWYEPHPVACMWLMVFGVILGRTQMHTGHSASGSNYDYSWSSEAYGWPLICRESDIKDYRAWGLHAPPASTIGSHTYYGYVIINAFAWLIMVVSTTALLETFMRDRFRISLRALLGVVTVVGVLFFLRSMEPIYSTLATAGPTAASNSLAPLRGPWHVSVPVMLGFGCTIYVAGWLYIRVAKHILGLCRRGLRSEPAQID